MSSAPQPLSTPHDIKSLWARRLSASSCLALTDRAFARYLDTAALPGGSRSEFRLPTKQRIGGKWDQRLDGWGVVGPPGGLVGTEDEARDEEMAEPCAYLAGNSLGLQPKRASHLVLEEMDVWADKWALSSALNPQADPAQRRARSLRPPAREALEGHGRVRPRRRRPALRSVPVSSLSSWRSSVVKERSRTRSPSPAR